MKAIWGTGAAELQAQEKLKQWLSAVLGAGCKNIKTSSAVWEESNSKGLCQELPSVPPWHLLGCRVPRAFAKLNKTTCLLEQLWLTSGTPKSSEPVSFCVHLPHTITVFPLST